ncbi:MAG TPA: hypothetical protein P5181_09155 [Dermatophilaceae bacterium]|nr:hypothetical protein [Dermatophilaceae bacterium]
MSSESGSRPDPDERLAVPPLPATEASDPTTDTTDVTDPTAQQVRELLAHLPEPGPMPADVMVRVLAALAAERAGSGLDRLSDERADALVAVPELSDDLPGLDLESASAATVSSDGAEPPAGSIATVVPLADRRRGGGLDPGRRLLVAASIAAMLVGLGVVANLIQDRIEVGGPAAAVLPSSTRPASPQRVVLATGRDYRPESLVRDATELAASATGSVRPPEGERLATSAGLGECLGALGQQDAGRVVVDLATYAGQPAAVVVAQSGGRSSVFVVGRGCSAADPAVIAPQHPL